MVETQKVYGGLPPDERKADRVDRLLAAGLEVFGTKGLEGATIRDVCEHARLSRSYLYESFGGLPELFVTLAHHVADQAEAAVRDAALAGTADGRMGRALAAVVDHFAEDPRRARVALVETQATEELRAIRRAYILRVAIDIPIALGLATSPRRPRRPDAATVAAVEGVAAVIVAWLSGDLAISRATLLRETGAALDQFAASRLSP